MVDGILKEGGENTIKLKIEWESENHNINTIKSNKKKKNIITYKLECLPNEEESSEKVVNKQERGVENKSKHRTSPTIYNGTSIAYNEPPIADT